MATVESNFFEIQRRAYQWNRFSTLDDGVSPLGWDNDPNLCIAGRTAGEDKLISMPIGAFYIRSNGDHYYKHTMPNTWAYIASNVQQTSNHFATYEFSDALEWIVNHNKNTTVFNETLFDSFGNKFFAPVNIIDTNSFTVRLTSATSGKVHVLFST
jgi:hypothetical protein